MKRVLITMSLLIVCLFLSCARRAAERFSNPSSKEVPHPQIHFPFDEDEVAQDEIRFVETNAEWLKQNRSAVVILEGHCDEAGPTNYNMELGDKRARTIKEYLIARGVSHDKIIMVVSFGDTRPLDVSHTQEAWKKNRRVEFVLR